jgi:hypothetical protein
MPQPDNPAAAPAPPTEGSLKKFWGNVKNLWTDLPGLAKWGLSILLLVAVALVAYVIFEHSSESGERFPDDAPAEFLYLDSGRAASYLAQIDGGSFNEEKVVNKLTDTLNGKLSVPESGEVGATRARELLTERVLQPTDASTYFRLSEKLENGHIDEVGLRHFRSDFEDGLEEGDFISFKTTAMIAPLYLNAYLAVRQANTLEALFPDSVERRRAARGFFDDVGTNPRAVFALRPIKKGGASGTGGVGTAASGTEDAPQAPVQRQHVVYLLPIRTRSLTAERSLIKYGGGEFTVVGKVVRVFPEISDTHKPPYIDSPTLETWEQPLLRAPGELLCRTEQKCIDDVRAGIVVDKNGKEEDLEHPLAGEQRHHAVEEARKRILAALKSQTTIDSRGAVVLPIAIYK